VRSFADIKKKKKKKKMAAAWRDLDGVAMQFDDEELQIQVVGAGNPYWRMPSYIIEFWCKKDGCSDNHFGGSAPVGTELSEIVARCKNAHKVCEKEDEDEDEDEE
jgi:hypothetical protein